VEKIKQIMSLVIDIFPSCSFELEKTENRNVLRIDPKKNVLEPDEIENLCTIHPFRLILMPNGTVFSNSSLKLVFEFE